MHKATLRGATLKNVVLRDSNLTEADLTGADLSDSDCSGTDFSGAIMFGVDLTDTNLFQARFDKTRLRPKSRKILHSNSRSWARWCKNHHYGESSESERLEQAVAIHLELKENFKSIGAYEEASKAYVEERRMRRAQHCPLVAHQCFESDYPDSQGARVLFFLRHCLVWLADAFIDLTTEYGESLWRTMLTLLVFATIVFPVAYSLSGGVVLNTSGKVSKEYVHLVLFCVGNLFQGYPGFEAATEFGGGIQVVQQFFAVMMIGLLGFVLGKKINQG
jgi:uncharacterized protein YjbI with pentapeptide repeats